MRGVGDQRLNKATVDILVAVARENADEWRETGRYAFGLAKVEALKRARLYDQLAELFDTVGEAEELAQFEDRNTLAVRQGGGQ